MALSISKITGIMMALTIFSFTASLYSVNNINKSLQANILETAPGQAVIGNQDKIYEVGNYLLPQTVLNWQRIEAQAPQNINKTNIDPAESQKKLVRVKKYVGSY
ncbi:MAG: hypothetical protein UR28_C0007G0014 [Candidatus Peregrinibacteria bacterium GW2011_GWF2_33_10]|nr:MAG: hypothetical protein UR28_C0007G0014 [Candidatus Peregrinibacteria bacterium GW2011_GWF2_33_10]OGJ44245.1 MAG: hypothetical protein A2272_04115 [Candidatus Peregrinibacteria bacterium RIFOXYA12_FULL_33_12]OGJ44903.1 MAG: hypothetical protein A2263_03180 [Candidatus Peregrinibacteria bacterium RIFOXYA2_FULL_33_21]OGJ50662.1 MAG: hypothetical protein A2307_03470 [Candidatus Peregrinibacteria bacterium RIFOXYB2_FULL_33_20]